MLTGLAGLSCGIGAAALYLAHPNQVARARPLPQPLGLIGGIACLLGLVLWIVAHGVLVGMTIALTLWMLVFALLPYLAAWLGYRAQPAPRPGRRNDAGQSR